MSGAIAAVFENKVAPLLTHVREYSTPLNGQQTKRLLKALPQQACTTFGAHTYHSNTWTPTCAAASRALARVHRGSPKSTRPWLDSSRHPWGGDVPEEDRAHEEGGRTSCCTPQAIYDSHVQGRLEFVSRDSSQDPKVHHLHHGQHQRRWARWVRKTAGWLDAARESHHRRVRDESRRGLHASRGG